MTVPEYTIGGLFLISFFLIAEKTRIAFQFRKKKKSYPLPSVYKTGTSKTIGDREIQEDEYGITELDEGIMAVVADGMGRQSGGKIAARLAVQVFQEIFEDENAFYNPQYSLRKAFYGANREILNQIEENQGYASVGAAIVKNRRLYYAVAGNVKIAVYRNKELVSISAGHTIGVLAQQKYEEGKLTRQEAVQLLEQHRLYNYVGQDGFQEIEFFDTPIILYGGEYVLLMSDGLYETARWKEIEDILEQEGDCQKKAYQIIELVNQSEQENKDNAAVVLIQIP